MVICFIALPILLILAIFSAEYRQLAKEAFDCVFRRATFRKCRTNFDARVKSKLVGRLMAKSPSLAGFVFKNFERLSWLFILLTIASVVIVGYGGYNYAKYGNCYGPESHDYCAFSGAEMSTVTNDYTGKLVQPTEGGDPAIGPTNASVLIIEFGCYMCSYTKEAEPIVKQLLEKYKGQIRYVYRDFPVTATHAESDWHSEAARCAGEQGKFWEYHDELFKMQETCLTVEQHVDFLKYIASQLELNTTKFNECVDSRKYMANVIQDREDGLKAGVDGTPYFFINNRTIVGPKKLAAFESVIDGELAKAENVGKAVATGAIVQK
jgi:protein-disulfide isomerase